MEFKTEKLVRFYPDRKQHPQLEKPAGSQHVRKPSHSYNIPSPLLRNPDSDGRIFGTSKFNKSKIFPKDHEPWRKRILDPGSELVLKWNRVFLISCLVALFIDPLYLYLPLVGRSACMKMDLNLSIAVTCFRIVTDLFYLSNMFLKFRLAYVAPCSRVFGRGELVMDSKKIASRYLRSDFFIDLFAMLPLPQVLGASWYLLSIERQTTCWKSECQKEIEFPNGTKCDFDFFDCDTLNKPNRMNWANNTQVFLNCNPGNNIDFKFGIFADALTKNIVSSKFIDKYFYCLWWGLRNLSSYGQSPSTSTFIGETLFAILIAIVGLILFAHLIGNMQTYLQSITVRLEEWRLKRRDTEEWMKHRQLPQNLRERVRRFVQYKWLATRGVDEESILRALPTDLRRDIQRHLCLDLVRRVPFFSQMDDLLLDAICERLVSSLSTEGTFIVREGDPITEMLFIIRGRLESSTTNGGRTGFFNSITLRPGDFCGEELLAWALLPRSSLNLPSSTRTVRALVEVEAFALRAEDLKYVANQFRRLHSKKLQHTFRFYSHHWRTWAACFIQAAWRRFKRRQSAKDLTLQESFFFMLDESEGDGTAVQEEEDYDSEPDSPTQARQNIGVSILESRFAASMRRGAQKIKGMEMSKLQKPDEPDFSAEADDD
ncbi:probable cyclic nucleotide-gated ion channel 14 isoform X2 [Magnolia sinica]|uniref:probable cyclic nucleotide-gated ion channel 14 isoform X2 n=1 Tax=Magnolia sinica TaxID=86752 RepID=UPI00265A3D93|nr:probable cyclic nucleotide-gated ion channel 14 isoform X2 [Magnolia sinica]